MREPITSESLKNQPSLFIDIGTEKQSSESKPTANQFNANASATSTPAQKTQLEQIVALHKQGDLEEAEKQYRALLKTYPGDADATHLLGVIYLQRQDYPRSEEWINKALSLTPGQGIYLNSLGRLYRETGRFEQAEKSILRSCELRPNDSATHLNLGKLYVETKQWKLAENAFRKTLDLDNSLHEARVQLIIALSHQELYEQAMEATEVAKEQQPEDANAWGMWAYLQLKAQNYEETIVGYQKSLQFDATIATSWSNLGVAHQAVCQFEEARDCYEKAIALDETLIEALHNLGTSMLVFGDLEKAEQFFQKSSALDHDYLEPRYCLGEIELARGNYPEGWEGYELRWSKPKHDHRNFGHEVWDEKSLDGKRLLVFTEQGIGDVVMFASCLPDLLEKNANVLVECDERMIPILERSFPKLQCTMRSPDVTVGIQTRFPDVDCQVGIGSLARVYRQSSNDFPRTPYLVGDSTLREKWSQRLAELGSGLKIGISWKGGNSKQVGYKRKTEFSQWKSILQTPNTQFVNLQYGDCQAEIEEAKNNFGVTLNTWDDLDPIFDLENVFALMSELDLVISIDNATVHFAGALGVPCWAMLHKVPEWRWGLKGEQCDWYATTKLFRQSIALQWEDVFANIEEELKETAALFLIKKSRAVHPPKQTTPLPIKTIATTQTPSLQTSQLQTQSPIMKPLAMKPKCGAVLAILGEAGAQTQSDQFASLERAWNPKTAAFSEVYPIKMNDPSEGTHFSAAFNFGIRRAAEQGCEWAVLLKPGDRVAPQAFSAVSPYLEDYDAIWGDIFYMQPGTDSATRLANQIAATNCVEDILQAQPEQVLHSGHFVRVSVAKQFPFLEANHWGALAGHLLHLWLHHRSIKIDQPLVAGFHPELGLNQQQIAQQREMNRLMWEKAHSESRAA